MKNLNKIYPYLLVIAGFAIISIIYFYPVMQGKKVFQSDIAQYIGMAKEKTELRKTTGDEPYWNNRDICNRFIVYQCHAVNQSQACFICYN